MLSDVGGAMTVWWSLDNVVDSGITFSDRAKRHCQLQCEQVVEPSDVVGDGVTE